MPPGLIFEHQDAAAVLEDFVNRSANLALELQFYQDEITEKNRLMQICLDAINQRDAAIQKFIKTNHSTAPYAKEAAFRKQVLENYDRVQILQEEKVALSEKQKKALDRQILNLDKQIAALQDRGELPKDDDIPTLLRGDDSAVLQMQQNAKAALASKNADMLNNHVATASRPSQQQSRPTVQTNVSSLTTAQSTPTAGSPAANLILQRQREASAGASNKRQRLSVAAGNVPVSSSGLARHSSTGPGTPKAGTPTGRAGSAGPARSQKTIATVGKKTAPHKQNGTVRKAKPGKSGLSRVKRSGQKSSPGSTNDSELSDAESGASGEDEENVTPPPGKKGRDENEMDVDEEEGDQTKYCICQTVSFGDMVACDNEDCPNEWFHWGCVGLKSEPSGTWYCPDCTKLMKDEKKK